MKKLLISFILLFFLLTPIRAFSSLITDPVGDATGMCDVIMMDAIFDTNYLYLKAKFSDNVISHQPGELISGALYGFIGLDHKFGHCTNVIPAKAGIQK